MKESVFSKKDTQKAKAVAIILMLIHHLFRFPESLNDVSYVSLFFFFPTLEYWIGDFGKICVAMYLFLSGMGMFFVTNANPSTREIMRRGLSFLLNFWTVFLFYVPIGLIFFSDTPRYSWNINTFIANFLALSHSYNESWWFVQIYLELLIVFPFLRKTVLERSVVKAFIIVIGLYISTSFFSGFLKVLPKGVINYVLIELQKLLFWQGVFCFGYIFAKHAIFDSFLIWLKDRRLNSLPIYTLAIMSIFAIRILTTIFFERIGKGGAVYFDLFLTPFFIFFVIQLLNTTNNCINTPLNILGKHSTNIWLTHAFFYNYYFKQIVFAPRISLLILSWLLILCIASSMMMQYIIFNIMDHRKNSI